MPLKVNDFSIQAKVIQTCGDESAGANTGAGGDTTSTPSISPSMKKEIIDECMEKVKEYLERAGSRY